MLKFTGLTHYTVHRVDLKFQFFSLKVCGDTKPGTFCPSRQKSKLIGRSILTVCSRKQSILSVSARSKLTGRSILTDAETDKIDQVLISTNLHWKKLKLEGVFNIYTGVCLCTKQGVCIFTTLGVVYIYYAGWGV